jgi:hypothetical protein
LDGEVWSYGKWKLIVQKMLNLVNLKTTSR